MIETKPCTGCGKKMIKFLSDLRNGQHEDIYQWICKCGNSEIIGNNQDVLKIHGFMGLMLTRWEQAQLDDAEDYYLGTDVMNRVRNGHEKIYSSSEVRKNIKPES
jgi:hypothetical protein